MIYLRVILLSFFGVCFFVVPSFAQENVVFHQSLKDTANRVMQNIYEGIDYQKTRYEELSAFDSTYQLINSHGISVIEYAQPIDVDDHYQDSPYKFGVTIVPLDEDPFLDEGDTIIEKEYPLLGIKLIGYLHRRFRRQFDVQSLIEKHARLLEEYQQQFLPLDLDVTTDKKSYQRGEKISFTVTLENTTDRALRVKVLNGQTLFIQYDQTRVKSKKVLRDEYVMLSPTEKLSKTFTGSAYQFAKDFEIYVSYAMAFEGIKPFSTATVRVER